MCCFTSCPALSTRRWTISYTHLLRWLKAEREARGLPYLLEVDGGVDAATAPLCVEAVSYTHLDVYKRQEYKETDVLPEYDALFNGSTHADMKFAGWSTKQ